MKLTSILICLLFAIAANSFTAAKAQVNVTDSLALVDLYNSTNGPHWRTHTNWLTTKPVSTWFGITVTGSHVVKVVLSYNNLNGTIPVSTGNLSSLNNLTLENNTQLTGTLPATIGNLTNLTVLNLNEAQLSGAIPAEIGNLTNLTDLELIFNKFTGTIPATIGNLTNLTYLDFYGNQLSGTIPTEIGNLKNLTTFAVSYNELTGTIPIEIGNLKKLIYLDLGNNQLSGAIPAEIGNLKNLINLRSYNNQLSGAIPASIGNLTNLTVLSLDFNRLTGTVPASLDKLKNCYIYLNYNQLSQFGNFHSSKDTNYQIHCYIDHNLFTFTGLQVIAKNYRKIVYAPQDTILPIHQHGGILSVYAGGTLSNNTYTWYKAGSINSTTIKGDSAFSPAQSGMYYVSVINKVAKKLTLYSDTFSYTMPLAQTQNSIANVAAVKIVNSHFSVYPNPAKDIVHIQVAGNAIITLTNSGGKILLTKTINNSDAINVSSYANGIYYIQNKTTGETQKMVVVH